MQCSTILPNTCEQEFHTSFSPSNLAVQACKIMVISLAIISTVAGFLVFEPIISLTAGCFLWIGVFACCDNGAVHESYCLPFPHYTSDPWYSYISPWRRYSRPTAMIGPSPLIIRPVYNHGLHSRVGIGTRTIHHIPVHTTRPYPSTASIHTTRHNPRFHVPVGKRFHLPTTSFHSSLGQRRR